MNRAGPSSVSGPKSTMNWLTNRRMDQSGKRPMQAAMAPLPVTRPCPLAIMAVPSWTSAAMTMIGWSQALPNETCRVDARPASFS